MKERSFKFLRLTSVSFLIFCNSVVFAFANDTEGFIDSPAILYTAIFAVVLAVVFYVLGIGKFSFAGLMIGLLCVGLYGLQSWIMNPSRDIVEVNKQAAVETNLTNLRVQLTDDQEKCKRFDKSIHLGGDYIPDSDPDSAYNVCLNSALQKYQNAVEEIEKRLAEKQVSRMIMRQILVYVPVVFVVGWLMLRFVF